MERMLVLASGAVALAAAIAVVAATRPGSALERLGLMLTPIGVAVLVVLAWIHVG